MNIDTDHSAEGEQLAQSIRRRHANPLTASIEQGDITIQDIALAVGACNNELEANRLPLSENYTMGSVNEYLLPSDVASGLGIAEGPVQSNIIQTKREVVDRRVREGKPLSDYSAPPGWAETREAFGEFIRRMTGKAQPIDQIAITYGGSDGLGRSLSALNHLASDGQPPTAYVPVPGYPPFLDLCRERRIRSAPIGVDRKTGYCPTDQQLIDTLGEPNNNTDTLYLVPVTNPCSTLYDLEALAGALQMWQLLRPQGVVLMDEAYLTMASPHFAQALFKLCDRLNNHRIMHICSFSKDHARPGSRMGAMLTRDTELQTAVLRTTRAAHPSISSDMQLTMIGVLTHVSDAARRAWIDVLRSRQQRLLNKLEPYIEWANTANPMYVYTQLDRHPFELAAETGLWSIPGKLFGDNTPNTARFALGAVGI